MTDHKGSRVWVTHPAYTGPAVVVRAHLSGVSVRAPNGDVYLASSCEVRNLVDYIQEEAARRGTERGLAASMEKEPDSETPSWLSGEWAGESINELLGDLIELATSNFLDPEGAAADQICDTYEQAADVAYNI